MDSYTLLPNDIPNAPILRVRIINPILNIEKRPRAIIDSGGDITSIPNKTIKDLKLVQSGFEDIGGRGRTPTYIVDISLKRFKFKYRKVIDSEDGLVWLGRDIINDLNVLLKGKDEKFDITDP